MAVHIIDDAPIDLYLTRDQYNKLLDEYSKAFMFYSGTPPTFESWVLSKGYRTDSRNITWSGQG